MIIISTPQNFPITHPISMGLLTIREYNIAFKYLEAKKEVENYNKILLEKAPGAVLKELPKFPRFTGDENEDKRHIVKVVEDFLNLSHEAVKSFLKSLKNGPESPVVNVQLDDNSYDSGYYEESNNSEILPVNPKSLIAVTDDVEMILIYSFNDICINLVNGIKCDSNCPANHVFPSRSKCLDRILGGGIRSSAITDIHGLSGSGKTQLCFELMLNTIFSSSNNNIVDYNVAYISTKKCFMPERIKQMINQHKKKIMDAVGGSSNDVTFDFTEHNILRRILYKQVFDYDELSFAVHSLHTMISERKDSNNIKLVVIDTFSAHIRDLNGWDKIRFSYELLEVLCEIAKEFNIVVLLTSDMTVICTGITKTGEQKFSFKQALGDSYLHRISQSIELLNINGVIEAKTIKQLVSKPGRTKFVIDEDLGISDIHEEIKKIETEVKGALIKLP